MWFDEREKKFAVDIGYGEGRNCNQIVQIRNLDVLCVGIASGNMTWKWK